MLLTVARLIVQFMLRNCERSAMAEGDANAQPTTAEHARLEETRDRKIGFLHRFDSGQDGHERQQCFIAAGLAPLDAALFEKSKQALAIDDALSNQESAKRDLRHRCA